MANLLLLLAVSLVWSTTASGEPGRFLAVVSENDLYVDGKDRHYTAGTQVAYGFAKGKAPGFLSWLGALSPLDAGPASREINLGLGQVIATPEELWRRDPDPADRPYGGWLYGELSATSRSTRIEDEIGISLGIIGPSSLAEDAHELLHELTPSADPRGWHAQIGDEPAVLLRYRRSWFIPVKPDDVWKGDIVPRAQVTLGNVHTELDLGLAWRFGTYVPRRDLPLRIAPGINSGSPRFEARRGRIDWMFRAEVVARAIAHNVFLDGSLFDDGDPSVDSKTFSWDASAGVHFTFGNVPWPFAVAFTYVWREEEFNGQRGMNRFGSITLALQF